MLFEEIFSLKWFVRYCEGQKNVRRKLVRLIMVRAGGFREKSAGLGKYRDREAFRFILFFVLRGLFI